MEAREREILLALGLPDPYHPALPVSTKARGAARTQAERPRAARSAA
jgi:hypothetical protein